MTIKNEELMYVPKKHADFIPILDWERKLKL
jgi:hypothetical protein